MGGGGGAVRRGGGPFQRSAALNVSGLQSQSQTTHSVPPRPSPWGGTGRDRAAGGGSSGQLARCPATTVTSRRAGTPGAPRHIAH